jgi:hypothetical protein
MKSIEEGRHRRGRLHGSELLHIMGVIVTKKSVCDVLP